jgi:hypothetical protein
MADASTGRRRVSALGNVQKRTSWSVELTGAGPFYWSVQAIDASYAGSPFASEQSTLITAVEDRPDETAAILWSDGPNPFSHATLARFRVARSERVVLAAYDVAGRRVRSLADDDYAPGVFEATWDGEDDAGQSLPSGVYFLRLTTDSREQSIKVLLTR